jgi:phytoene synthase
MSNQPDQIVKESKSSFAYSFSLLAQPKREAMNTIYAFCRRTDDIVDEGNDPEEVRFEKLHKWRIELEKAIYSTSEFPLFNKLAGIIKQFNIPVDPFFQLIVGMEMDLQRKRYPSFDELKLYCYCVASTVGLMCIEIFGYKNKSTKDYAVNLGLALQLTNILRDINKDLERGRIYIPQNDMKKFNYSEKDFKSNTYNENFISLMKYESERADEYFKKATEILAVEDKLAMFPARAMQHIYQKLLKKIVNKNYDVFNNRIRVNNFEKAAISIGVWAKYSLVY